jgi:hypothetical protein
MVKTIDVEKAECYSAEDKLMIQNDIIQHHKTFSRFNDMLKVSWHSVKVYSRKSTPDMTSSTAASHAQPPFSQDGESSNHQISFCLTDPPRLPDRF